MLISFTPEVLWENKMVAFEAVPVNSEEIISMEQILYFWPVAF